MSDVLWEPRAGQPTRIGDFMTWLRTRRGQEFDGYPALWAWSVADLPGFWSAIAEHHGVIWDEPGRTVLEGHMPSARWFPGARLNYARHALRTIPDDAPAVLSHSQTRPARVLTGAELRDQVGRARAGLVRLGVGTGDRVAAYLPNIDETLVAFLATASIGAIWCSCAPEFGVRSVVDRLSQIAPKVLLAVDGYRYGARAVDRTAEVAEIRAALPSLETVVALPYLHADDRRIPDSVSWADLLSDPEPVEFAPVAFDHPLYILFSSGTTGLPKPIVHGHGGILLEHLKQLGLHCDLGPGDRFFWFSTTGWMMWNLLVSGLLVGATVVCFDGDPGHPDLGAVWRLVDEAGITFLGTSATFLLACRKARLRPRDEATLRTLRSVGSTGAPLPAEGFRWVYEALGDDIFLSSISGGTDVCTAFVGGCPLLPVRAGVIACRFLGAHVEAFDEHGRSVIGTQGELVVTAPLPSMPVAFWGDADGSRLRAAYFDVFPGVWRHGDWITIEKDGSCVITGRSDSTLNRGGVRVGTSEFYSVVESLPEVVDSLVIHLEGGGRGGGADELLLFVVTAPGTTLDDELRSRLATELRRHLSPRHVPDRILRVDEIPRTLSGKKLEVPVKRILLGAGADGVASRESLVNPSALDAFIALAGERQIDGLS